MMRDFEEIRSLLRGVAIGLHTVDIDYARICDCAADAIEELQEKLIMAETDLSDFKDAMAWKEHFDILAEQDCQVPTWISVEERLPNVAEKVLTYNGDFVSENWLCTVASKVGRVNVWAYSEGFVTHWMPLPEPPKEDADNG